MPNRGASYRNKPRWWSLLLIPILALIGIATGSAAPPPPNQVAFETIELPPEAFSAPDALLVQTREGDTQVLDAAMTSLVSASRVSLPQARELAKSIGLRLSGDRAHVQIVVETASLPAVRQAIAKAGGEVTKVSEDETLVQGWLPLDALPSISERKDVHLIRRPAEAILLEPALAAGSTTEGLAALNGPAWHAAGYRGAGVKVGMIDGGFQGYTALLGTDLPSTVTVRNFVDGEGDSQVDGTTRHGTSCAEIMYDVAPQASLYLAKISTNLDLQEAVAWLRDTHQVDVISTSLGWYNITPGDGTGEFANLVQSARNAGIFWATAAGNDREAHWGGAYADANGNNIHEFNGKEINCFGPGGSDCYSINPGYPFQVFLRWDDWTSVNQDYDLYLVRWNGSSWSIVASSTNTQGGGPGQRPAEYAIAITSGSATSYGFYVRRFNSTRNVNLEVFAPKMARLNQILPARSLANLADAPAAMTVAALDVSAPYPQEVYSSEGPTNGSGGTAAGGSVKPDVSAYANVSTQGYGTRGFNGTSAATPHVAGAAALVLNANPGFTPTQVQSFLEQRAIDMGSAGKDTVYGYGRLYLGAPISADPPQITGITPSSAINTGTVRITNLAGSRFQSGATVTLTRSGYADILATNVVIVSESKITCDLNLNGAATGQWNVVVTNPDAQSATLLNGFTVTVSAPVVSSITPNVGVYTGWVRDLNVAGDNFRLGATVKLTKSNHPDIQAANVNWVSANALTCDLNLAGAANGPWNVVVTNPDGRSGTLANGFYVTVTGTAPRITSVNPTSGRNTGVLPTLTVVGSGFTASLSQPPTVKLTRLGRTDIVATNVSLVDANTLTCRLDLTGASPGLWNVVVINPNGEHWTLTDGFTVVGRLYLPIIARSCPPPTLQSIDNADGDGAYTVRWSLESCGASPSSWELQHGTDASFGAPTSIDISNPGQTSYAASTPTPGTYYWRVRVYRSGQGWSAWSNVQSVTVRQTLAEVWIDNDTDDTLTVEIVGVEKKSFSTGEHYWRTVTPGRYTIKAWGCNSSREDLWDLEPGKNTLWYYCTSSSDPQSRDSQIGVNGLLR
jgi:hypothetical protein